VSGNPENLSVVQQQAIDPILTESMLPNPRIADIRPCNSLRYNYSIAGFGNNGCPDDIKASGQKIIPWHFSLIEGKMPQTE